MTDAKELLLQYFINYLTKNRLEFVTVSVKVHQINNELLNYTNQRNSILKGITTKLTFLEQGTQLKLICFPEVIKKITCTP